MSEQERHERAETFKDEADTEQDTPDVEAHRLEGAGRAEATRMEESETEDRHRSDLGV